MDISTIEPGDVIVIPRYHAMLVIRGSRGGDAPLRVAHADGTLVTQKDYTSSELDEYAALEVLRSKRKALAAAATDIGVRWSDRGKIPYSSAARYAQMHVYHDKQKADSFARAKAEGLAKPGIYLGPIRAQFFTTGRFQAIKYTVRGLHNLPMFISNPAEPSKPEGKGIACSTFVILCYQVAALGPYVKALPPRPDEASDPGTWVSNKYGRRPTMAEARDPENPFLADNLRLFDRSALGIGEDMRGGKHREYANPLTQWRGGHLDAFPWAARLTAGMLLDARRSSANELALSLNDDRASWRRVGAGYERVPPGAVDRPLIDVSPGRRAAEWPPAPSRVPLRRRNSMW